MNTKRAFDKSVEDAFGAPESTPHLRVVPDPPESEESQSNSLPTQSASRSHAGLSMSGSTSSGGAFALFDSELDSNLGGLGDSGTLPVVAASQSGAPRMSALSGRLEDLAVADLAQTLEVNRKTGMLEVQSGGLRGSVAFEQGLVVGAWSHELRGEAALFRLLGLDHGSFSFFSGTNAIDDEGQQPGLPAPVQGLLMEGMRQIDECSRLRTDLPDVETVLAVRIRPLDLDAANHSAQLSEAARRLWMQIDVDTTLEELYLINRNSDLALLSELSELMVGGILEATSKRRELPRTALLPGFSGQAELPLGMGDSELDSLPRRRSNLGWGALGFVACAGAFVWGIGLDTSAQLLARHVHPMLAASPAAQEMLSQWTGYKPVQAEPGAPAVTHAPLAGLVPVAGPGDLQDEGDSGLVPVEIPRCPEGMKLVEGGKFFRGSQSEEAIFKNATPTHAVTLDDYCLDIHEVTVDQYRGCSQQGECERAHREVWWPKPAKKSKRSWKSERAALADLCNENHEHRGQHPVNCITWLQAQRFCKWRDSRLPTEAEWEYAARGSDGRVFPWGDSVPSETTLNACGEECVKRRAEDGLREVDPMYEGDDGYTATAPVGSFPEGEAQWGHMDLVGNVFEWVADAYLPYSEMDMILDADGVLNNPVQDEGDKRVIRGGAFNSYLPAFTDPALRFAMPELTRSHGIGFRCASTARPLAKGAQGSIEDESAEPAEPDLEARAGDELE